MTILQYCSVCKTEYDMEIVPTADDDGVLWLQCPNCKGFLPKVDTGRREPEPAPAANASADDDVATSDAASVPAALDLEAPDLDAELPDLDLDEAAEEAPAEPVAAEEGAELLAGMDVSRAVPYRPWHDYEVGAVLHHLAWDDYGVVLAKEVLPGNRHVVKVRFAEAGVVRLIEAQGEPPH